MVALIARIIAFVAGWSAAFATAWLASTFLVLALRNGRSC
jgi:hypothetical protein